MAVKLKRWTNERFDEVLKENTDGKYTRLGQVVNSNTMVKVVCNDCGTEQMKRPSDVDRRKRLGCKRCLKIETLTETFGKFKAILDSKGYTCRFNEWDLDNEGLRPSVVPVQVITPDGNEKTVKYIDFIEPSGRKIPRWSTETFKSWVAENVDGYLFKGKYVNNKTKALFECPHKHEFEMEPKSFRMGRRCPDCARIALSERYKGENSVFYDHTMSDEERKALAEARQDAKYAQFRRDVLRRDNHECQTCKNDEQLEVHHVYSFKTHEELRTDVNNGITLCHDCHVDFHRKYGYGDNTLEQFTDWLTNEHLMRTVTNRLAD